MIGYIAFGVVVFGFIGTLIMENCLNRDTERYRCYLQQLFRQKAEDLKCEGYYPHCKHCVYKKNYDREGK